MKIEKVNIQELISPAYNPRDITPEEMEKLKTSIEEFGYVDPLIVNEVNMHIVGGNQRYEALKSLGYETVDVVYVHEEDPNREKALNIALNKISGNWDFKKLNEIFEEFKINNFNTDFTGFDGLEIENLNLNNKDDEPKLTEDRYTKTEGEINITIKAGDLYQLGNHRLLCGDSTKKNDVEKLINNGKADITFTSPPYNAHHMDIPLSKSRGGGTQKGTQKKYLADNDKRTDEEYFKFLCDNMDLLLEYSKEIFYNIGVASGSKIAITQILHHYANQFKELMYWVKDNPIPVIHENIISSSTELIICFGEKGTRSFNNFNDRLFHGVIQGLSSATTNKYADVHKATFPLYLPSEIIQRFTKEKGTVFDCFGGTGTTLIACEQLNRKCYMMEIEPYYCQIIINRWEQLTGQKAKKIN